MRVLSGTLPLLLFSDPRMVYPVDVYDFQGQAVHRLHQQHIQLGLRKGMAVLVYYRVQGGQHVNTIFRLSSSHTSLLRLEERKLKTSFRNESSSSMVASISLSTAGSSRKLSHESRRKGVASLLAGCLRVLFL